MKINLLYLRILKKAEPNLPEVFPYAVGEKRWINTYKEFRPKIHHHVIICNCGSHTDYDDAFDDVAYSYAYYDGLGSDCGTYQAIAGAMDCDLVVCFNTLAYFWRHGWLEPIVAAAEKAPKGVYGVTSSFEHFPHLRTPCIAFHPEVMRAYPHICDQRQKAIEFESGRNNFSLWAADHGYPSLLVTQDGIHERHDWRVPPNIFRRGDQSNCLVWDRHTLVYADATAEQKKEYEQAADTSREV